MGGQLLNMAHELLAVFGGDVGDPPADVRRRGVGDEQGAMNDSVRLQLAFELDGFSDCDRDFCPELQPLFCQVQNIAEDGVSVVFQEGAAVYGEAELATLFSHNVGLRQ
jgi:hypothetical protein